MGLHDSSPIYERWLVGYNIRQLPVQTILVKPVHKPVGHLPRCVWQRWLLAETAPGRTANGSTRRKTVNGSTRKTAFVHAQTMAGGDDGWRRRWLEEQYGSRARLAGERGWQQESKHTFQDSNLKPHPECNGIRFVHGSR